MCGEGSFSMKMRRFIALLMVMSLLWSMANADISAAQIFDEFKMGAESFVPQSGWKHEREWVHCHCQ